MLGFVPQGTELAPYCSNLAFTALDVFAEFKLLEGLVSPHLLYEEYYRVGQKCWGKSLKGKVEV